MPPILELRVAITTADYDRLMDFYELALGLDPAAEWPSENGRAIVLR